MSEACLQFLVLEYQRNYIGNYAEANLSSKWQLVTLQTINKESIEVFLTNNTQIKCKFSEIRPLKDTNCDHYQTNSLRPGSNAVNTLMKMTGLVEVKRAFASVYDNVMIAKRQGVCLDDFNFNVLMMGNHCIGKSTVARLYCDFLSEIGVMPGGSSVLVKQGSDLNREGDIYLRQQTTGVVIIENFEDLDHSSDHAQRVLNHIAASASRKVVDKQHKLVWILTGLWRLHFVCRLLMTDHFQA